MDLIYNNIKILRESLIDKYDELKNIPDDLLILSLTRSIPLAFPKYLVSKLIATYGASTYQRFEFLGDAVLDMIVAEILFTDYNLLTSGDLTIAKSNIVNNISLICFSNSRQLCQLIIWQGQNINPLVESKSCADLFESIIGVIYYYLKMQKYPDPLYFILTWLKNEFQQED